jgi:hypothetical protein
LGNLKKPLDLAQAHPLLAPLVQFALSCISSSIKMNNLDILHAYWHARRNSDGSEPRKGLSKGVVAVIVIIVLLLLITLAGAVVWRFGMLGLDRWKRVRKEEAVRRKRVARRSVLAAGRSTLHLTKSTNR